MKNKKITVKWAKKIAVPLSVIFLFTGCQIVDLTDIELPMHNSDLTVNTLENDDNSPSHILPNNEAFFMDKKPYVSNEAQFWINNYEQKNGEGSSQKILLSTEEIKFLNQKIINDCPTVVNIADIPNEISGDDLRSMISHAKIPHGDRYDLNGTLITDYNKDAIKNNRNLDNIKETVNVKPAIISKRCNLQSFPTETTFFSYNDTHYNAIQETELIVGMPVWILHQSRDEKYLFVQSYHYTGWINRESAAICDIDTFTKWVKPEKYITVTTKRISVDNITLDMGTILPYISENNTDFYVQLPQTDKNGMLSFKQIYLSKESAVYMNLDYTIENVYAQAFAFLGEDYDWGGERGGVDCSGFICAVFRSFGIQLPRNTSEQSVYMGIEKKLLPENSVQILDDLKFPSTIHRPGHVMLYLGSNDGKYYVIHSPEAGKKVSVMEMDLPGNFTSAREIH